MHDDCPSHTLRQDAGEISHLGPRPFMCTKVGLVCSSERSPWEYAMHDDYPSNPLRQYAIVFGFADAPRYARIRVEVVPVFLLDVSFYRMMDAQRTESMLSAAAICCNLANFSRAPPKVV